MTCLVADLVIWATMLVVCGGLGLPVAMALPRRLAWRIALAPTFGSGILAVLVPIIYRFGVAMWLQLLIYAITAVSLIAWHVRRHGVPRDLVGRRVAIACAGAALVLWLPRFVGGDQFAVFQGNHWDTFGYLTASLAYGTKSYHAIAHAQMPQLLRNPFFANAQATFGLRPSVHQLYALFSRVMPGEAYRLYYTFLVWFMAQLVVVGVFFLRNLFPAAKPWSWVAIAIAFPLGFWGQYVLDINAWSQVASAPLLFAMFGFVLLATTSPDRADATRLAIGLGMATAGAVYVYPEGSFIMFAVLIPIAIATTLLRRRWHQTIAYAGFVGVLVAAAYPPTLQFLISQLSWGSKGNVPWWQFFQRFFLGRDNEWGDGFARTSDFMASTFGYYLATPKGDGLVLRIIVLGAIVGAIVAALRLTKDLVPRIWVVTAIFAMGPAALLALKANYWAAGKVLSYAAPLFVTALALPLVRADRWRWFAGAFVALQLAMALLRIPAARWHSHSGFATPYPSIQVLALKHDIGWDFRPLEPYFDHSSKVLLHHMEPWSETALQVFLTARGIPYVLEGPVIGVPGGAELGKMPMPWTPQLELVLVGDVATITYADGRSITVKTR